MHPSFLSQISRIKRFGLHLHRRRIRQIKQCLQSSGVRRRTNPTISKRASRWFQKHIDNQSGTFDIGKGQEEEKERTILHNTDLIFSRVLLLPGTNQIDFEDLFDFELAAVPTSLFEETGVARYPKNKSVLLNKLKVEESSRCIKPDATVIDGGGMLHKVHWPPNGIVKDLVDGIDHYVMMLMLNTDV